MDEKIEDKLRTIFSEAGTAPFDSRRFIDGRKEIEEVINKDNYSKKEVREILKMTLFTMSHVYIATGNTARIDLSSEKTYLDYRKINQTAHVLKWQKSGGDKTKEISNIHKAKEHWDEWQKNPNLYKSKAAFKKDMVERKYARNVESPRKWIIQWKEANKKAAARQERKNRDVAEYMKIVQERIQILKAMGYDEQQSAQEIIEETMKINQFLALTRDSSTSLKAKNLKKI